MTRYAIVNADDFGLSSGINRGIIEAHTQGIVSSASLMVRQPAAEEAAELSREHPGLAVGMHLDFGEWAYRNGEWVQMYEVVSGRNADGVAAEFQRQLARFRELMGRNPTHIDS